MSDEENKNMGYGRRSWGWKCFFILPLVALAIFVAGAVVMALWNCVMPGLFPTIGLLTYWHALGLLLLCKILFGSFRKGCHGDGWRGRRMHNAAWKEKWSQMSDEEKAKFKEQWKSRCNDRC